MQYVIDTNIFLRVLYKEDEKTFQECFSVLESIKQKKYQAFVPGIVLSEVAWTLSTYYKLPKSKVVEALNSILNLPGASIIDECDYRFAIDLYKQKSVKYIDTCIASLQILRLQQAELISYDRDFDKLNAISREPGQIKS